MPRFSIIENKEIEKKVLNDVKVIKETLLKRFSNNILAIILVGGFGRGEGGVVLSESGIRVVNDYDLHVITRLPVKSEEVKQICADLAKRIRVEHIDIVIEPLYFLRLLKNTQYGYDLRYGSYIIYGDQNILNKALPKFSSISPKEIEKLFFTRIWCFLGPLKREFIENKPQHSESLFFLYNQLGKALLALEESILIANNDYHPSYVEKLKRVKKYCSSRLIRYFEWATEQKLKPRLIWDLDPIAFYFDVKNIFLSEMKKLIHSCYQVRFKEWDEYTEWYLCRIDVKLKCLLQFLHRRRLSYNKFVRTKLAQILLTAAIHKHNVNEELTKKAYTLLIGDCHCLNKRDAWELWWRLKEISLKMQNLYQE